MSTRGSRALLAAALAALSVAATACGANEEGGASGGGKEIVVGASLPLTGPGGQIGSLIREGYEAAVQDANRDGGVQVGDERRRLRLRILDNATNATTATQQVRTLVQRDGAVALLSAGPDLTITLSNVAEALRVPFLGTFTPQRAWLAANPDGWKYAWNTFFDEQEYATLGFQAAALTKTNRRVAVFADTEAAREQLAKAWKQLAPRFGHKVVYRARFPSGTTDYAPFINRAREAGAEVVFAPVSLVDGIALWRQMKALGYRPRVASFDQAANTVAWQRALREDAAGALAVDTWNPDAGNPGSKELVDRFAPRYGNNPTLSGLANVYALLEILETAIEKAGSTDREKVNEEIGRTDIQTTYGRIRFGDDNRWAAPLYMSQWNDRGTEIVFPRKVAGAELAVPPAGLDR